MKQKIKKASRKIARQVPLVSNWWNNWEFRVERNLIEDRYQKSSPPPSTHRSIIHFSMNKAATQYVRRILRSCAKENEIVYAGINDYAFHSNFPYLNALSAAEMEQYHHIFRPYGYLYSVFGGAIEGIPNFNDYDVILMIRDPRDILTSNYFSMKHSHQPPEGQNKIAKFMKKRTLAQNVDVDEYVLQQKEEIFQTYQRYLDLMIDQPNVYVTRYEDMIADFPLWLDNLLGHCSLNISSQLKQSLLDEADKSRPKTENTSQHMRQVNPGNYKNKLQPNTITQLDCFFSQILTKFEYS